MQVYVTDTVASVVTANQFLAGFERVSLKWVLLYYNSYIIKLWKHDVYEMTF